MVEANIGRTDERRTKEKNGNGKIQQFLDWSGGERKLEGTTRRPRGDVLDLYVFCQDGDTNMYDVGGGC